VGDQDALYRLEGHIAKALLGQLPQEEPQEGVQSRLQFPDGQDLGQRIQKG